MNALAPIYLILFISPQVLLYLYLLERLPDPDRPAAARRVRIVLTVLFVVFNLPWILVGGRILFGSVWGIGRIPWIAPFIAWQMLSWIFGALVSIYVLWKGLRGMWDVGRSQLQRLSGPHRHVPHPTHHAVDSSVEVITRRRFLARATYSYAAAGAALSAYGIWSAMRRPEVTRVTLRFPTLPAGLDGMTIAHVSDVHAGIHLVEEDMREIVALTNALRPDLVAITGDLIDISRSFIPQYTRAFRDLQPPAIAVMGNHDRYTGEDAVVVGAKDAGHIVLRNAVHVVERGGAVLALAGVEDPRGWGRDDPQRVDVDVTLRRTPPEAFTIMLAHRPGAFDGAAPRGVPLTLAGHIHGGQLYIPGIGWSAGSLITKYVMGHFRQGDSQLYVSRGIGVVGVPIRIFTPPEIVLLTLRAG